MRSEIKRLNCVIILCLITEHASQRFTLSLSQEENYFFSNLLEVHVLSHQHSIVH